MHAIELARVQEAAKHRAGRLAKALESLSDRVLLKHAEDLAAQLDDEHPTPFTAQELEHLRDEVSDE